MIGLAGVGILSGSRFWRRATVVVVSLRMAWALFAMVAHPHGAYFTAGLVSLLIGTFVIWALYGHKESDEYYRGAY